MTVNLPKPVQRSPSVPKTADFPIMIMDRYIFGALWMRFLGGVGAFLAIGLVIGKGFEVLRRITENGLPLTAALHIMGLQIPTFLVLALPMSTLLACLMVYNQLSRTSELMALRSCGVSVYRLALPALCLSLLVASLTFSLSEWVVPNANYRSSLLMAKALNRERPTFQDKNIFYREFDHDLLSRVFYARRFDGESMLDLTVLEFLEGNLSQILVTEAARWEPGLKAWGLSQGTLYQLANDSATYQTISQFDHQQLQFPRAPLDLAMEPRRSDQMGIDQMQRYLKLLRGSGDVRQIRKYAVRLQVKYAFPLICVIFAIVGAALGTRFQRRTPSQGFGLSIVIIFSYYTFSFVTHSLGEAGILSALTAAWLPTLVGFSVGGVLLWQANR